jgi:hypothetical protein
MTPSRIDKIMPTPNPSVGAMQRGISEDHVDFMRADATKYYEVPGNLDYYSIAPVTDW